MSNFAGFDIGGTNARVCLYDSSWQMLAELRQGVRGSAPEEMAQVMGAMLRQVCDAAKIPPRAITSVGVGLAAQLAPGGQVVLNAPNLGWRDVPFARLLGEEFRPDIGASHVLIVNDLNAILWGEHCAGAVRGVADVLAVYVGTGVGGAILCDGQLFRSAGGKAGEIGHSKVVPGGRLCGCGEYGCVEAYAGGLNLEQMAAEIARQQGIDAVLAVDAQVLADLKVADTMAAQGHPEFDALWQRATDYLALIMANACTLLNPSVLLLGGGVLMNLDNFRARVLTKVPPLVLQAAREDLEIRFPQLHNDAGVLGAARLAAQAARGK